MAAPCHNPQRTQTTDSTMPTKPEYQPLSSLDLAISYDRSDTLSTLDRFNLASCARARMTQNVLDGKRWTREMVTFRSHVASIEPLQPSTFYDRG